MGEIGNKTVFDDDLVFSIQKAETPPELFWQVVPCGESTADVAEMCGAVTALAGEANTCEPKVGICEGECYKELVSCMLAAGLKSLFANMTGGSSSTSEESQYFDCSGPIASQPKECKDYNDPNIGFCGTMDENNHLVPFTGLPDARSGINCKCGVTIVGTGIDPASGVTSTIQGVPGGCSAIGCVPQNVTRGGPDSDNCNQLVTKDCLSCPQNNTPIDFSSPELDDCPNYKMEMITLPSGQQKLICGA